MARAVLLYGTEDDGNKRFRNEARLLARFLKKEAGISDVQLFCIDMPADMFKTKLKELLFFGRTDEPLLLTYSGHGVDGHWSPAGDETDFPYEALLAVIKNYPSPVLIINDCCYSFSIIAALKEADISPARLGVITATDRSGWAYGHMLTPEIIKKWRTRTSYPEQLLHDPLEDLLYYLPRFGEVEDEAWWRKTIAKLARLHCKLAVRLMYIVARLAFPGKYNAAYSFRWGAAFDYYFYAKPREEKTDG